MQLMQLKASLAVEVLGGDVLDALPAGGEGFVSFAMRTFPATQAISGPVNSARSELPRPARPAYRRRLRR